MKLILFDMLLDVTSGFLLLSVMPLLLLAMQLLKRLHHVLSLKRRSTPTWHVSNFSTM